MESKAIDSYKIYSEKIPLLIHIYSQESQPVPFYHLSLLNITEDTKRTIERIRNDIITGMSFDIRKKKTKQGEEDIKEQFREKLSNLIEGQFAGADGDTIELITEYILTTSLGLAELEFLLNDPNLEEIVINGAGINVWVYHKTYGWLKTNIVFNDENKIRHFATIIGRNVDRGISLLDPLLDAHLASGDRVNATLAPITSKGNTLTIRKFSKTPWTITSFLKNRTLDYTAAAMIWQAMQYELSILVVGGTGSGKTSFMNVIAGFFPPNQRIISIEDTRELKLPETLHWVPMQSRLPNPEGKGEITMLDCMINALRMRPDRIIVGEVRREKELEVLFEALHTGHSVYSTFHASNVNEAVARLSNPPISLPKQLMASLDLIVVQHRNRREGTRRTFQIAEIDDLGNPRIIMQHNNMQDKMIQVSMAQKIMNTLMLYTGMSQQQINSELQEKLLVLKWLVSKDITDINKVGMIISNYYTEKQHLLDLVRKNQDYETVK